MLSNYFGAYFTWEIQIKKWYKAINKFKQETLYGFQKAKYLLLP